jgi:type I restriction enzyme S subunit
MARNSFEAEIPLKVIGEFPPEWERSTLGRACSLVTDGTHDSPKESQTGFPLVTGKCITGGRIRLNEAYLISEQDHRAVIARSKPELGDILFANIGNSIGELARVETQTEFSIKNVALFKPSHKIESQFLKYYLLAPAVQSYIKGTTYGSAQPFIGLATLRSFPVPLPPIHEQRAIAHSLSLLDEKIELNRFMNETLKKTVAAIFKDWFLEFNRISASERIESEFGQIPPRWKITSLGNHVEAIRGLSYKGASLSGVGVALHNLNSVYEGGGYKYEGIKYYKGEFKDRHLVRAGDIIVANTEQGFDNLLLGYPAIIPRHFGEKGIFSHHLFRVVPRDGSPVTRHFLYYLLMVPLTRNQILGCTNGTTVNMLSSDGLNLPCFVLPPAELIQRFEAIASPIHDLIEANVECNKTLLELRNTLLPKLISGEIRLSIQTTMVDRQLASGKRSTSEHFKEAILIAALARALATLEFPLGRLRYNKLAYLVHRKTEHAVKEHYLKKAAGPYSPWAKYQGPEKIALQNGYIVRHKSGQHEGLIAGPKVEAIDSYLPRYDFSQTVGWVVNKFRYRKNDELELLTTVDFAVLDLITRSIPICVDNVKRVIAENSEWTPKLSRSIFSDSNIANAIAELRKHFPDIYGI